jgi:hypothetical protein
MSETSLQKFMKTFAATQQSGAKANNCSNAHGVNETMGAFFSVNPISAPFAASTTASAACPAVVAKPKTTGDKEIFVARYGKIYKRKAPSPLNCIKLNCAPGLRYCKLCDTHKPLVAFYTSVKRYVCRKCHKNRVSVRLKERVLADRTAAKTNDIWFRLSAARIWFGYPKIQFDSTTIRDIIENAQIPWEINPKACPIDPALPMRPRNVAVLSGKAFEVLIQLWKHTCSRANFIAFVQKCNMVPPRFDVAFPCDAFHDVNYVRPIIDIAPILKQELTDPHSMVDSGDHSCVQILQGRDLDDEIHPDYIAKYSREPAPHATRA